MSKRDHGTRKWFLIKKLVTSVDVKTRSRYSEMVFNEMDKETGYKCRCQNEITVLGNGF